MEDSPFNFLLSWIIRHELIKWWRRGCIADDDDAVDKDEGPYDMQNTVDIDGNDEKAMAAM